MILLTTTVLSAVILLLLFSGECVVARNLPCTLAWSSHTPSGELLEYPLPSCHESV